MATIKYTILRKGESLRAYREGYPTFSYKNLLDDVKVVIEESLIRYTLQVVVEGAIITVICDTFKMLKEDE